jgi:hypothetical protein
MTYAKFDDRCPEHPKIAALSDREFRSWFEMVCYSARNLTDGFVPGRIAKQRWDGQLHALLKARVVELVDGGGFRVHDYLDWNDSKQTVEQRRERARRAALSKASSPAPSRQQAEPQAQPSSRTRTTPEVQDQELPPTAGEDGWKATPHGWTDLEASLVRKLFSRDTAWGEMSEAGLNKLNRKYGKPAVGQALQHAWEETTAGTLVISSGPYPLLESICQKVSA